MPQNGVQFQRGRSMAGFVDRYGTDNPGISSTTLSQEYLAVSQMMPGGSIATVAQHTRCRVVLAARALVSSAPIAN